MSTRSKIIVEMDIEDPPSNDGAWGTIYVHRFGEPEERASLLLDHYADAEKARALIALGDLSLVDREITCPPGHSFDIPADGHSVAYGRDRGEEGEDDDAGPRFSPTLAVALRAANEEFVYVYHNALWWWAFTDDGPVQPEDLRRLTRDSSYDEGPTSV